MKLGFVMLAAALACAPVASAQTQSQMIVGKWSCASQTTNGYSTMQVDYGADGVAHSILIVGLGGEGGDGHAIIDVTSNWTTPGDNTLHDRVTKFRVVEFVLGGKDLDKAGLTAAGEALMAEDVMSGSLVITKTSMTMTDAGGIVTSCVR